MWMLTDSYPVIHEDISALSYISGCTKIYGIWNVALLHCAGFRTRLESDAVGARQLRATGVAHACIQLLLPQTLVVQHREIRVAVGVQVKGEEVQGHLAVCVPQSDASGQHCGRIRQPFLQLQHAFGPLLKHTRTP